MYFDLNVHVPTPASLGSAPAQLSRKAKGKQPQTAAAAAAPTVAYSPAQISAIEARIDLLVHLGYTVLAFTQTALKKVDQRTHVNVLDPLLVQLRKREGVVYLKRLTIVLDEESEKGFGLTNANSSLFSPYDIIALAPTTEAAFSYAVLTHTTPSNLTAHVLSIPLTLPRLPFRMKHTLVRTAIRNGAVFEINYAGALGVDDSDPSSGGGGGGSGSAATKRNWWAAAREVARVTKGKGLILSSGAHAETDLRAPRDVGNLATFLDLAQDVAHHAATTTPRSLVLRAETRKTYRAVFSEPKIVLPEGFIMQTDQPAPAAPAPVPAPVSMPVDAVPQTASAPAAQPQPPNGTSKKRPREDGSGGTPSASGGNKQDGGSEGGGSRKKKKKAKQQQQLGA